jgi:hypothetical protein
MSDVSRSLGVSVPFALVVLLVPLAAVAPAAWETEKITNAAGGFGLAVGTSDQLALIGAPLDTVDANDNAGSAFVYQHTASGWVQRQKLTHPSPTAQDRFAHAVGIDGTYAVVGVPFDDEDGDNAGTAFIYARSGDTWSVDGGRLTPGAGRDGDQFGLSVSISGTYAIAGAPFYDATGGADNDAGAAYVFQRTGGVWALDDTLLAPLADRNPADQFGRAVGISGTRCIVGAQQDDEADTDAGAAYVFDRSGGVWTQQAKLTADDAGAGDFFGVSASIDGDYAIVGAPQHDGGSTGEGAAYVFHWNGSLWEQQDKLTAGAFATASAGFGDSVAIHGDYAIVSAPVESDYATYFGAAYVFQRSGTSWDLATRLQVSSLLSQYGQDATIGGLYALVGANESPSDAAYSYRVPEPTTVALLSLGALPLVLRRRRRTGR